MSSYLIRGGIVVDGTGRDAFPADVLVEGDRIAASKAADKMLGIRGVEASFALAIAGSGVAVSARSKGRINVQLIMEKLDGGGHFDMAGAQLPGSMDDAVEALISAIDEYRMQFPEQCRVDN